MSTKDLIAEMTENVNKYGGENMTTYLMVQAIQRLTAVDKEIAALRSENEALRASLNKANAQTEEFERKWYLVTDERDALRARVEALTIENQALWTDRSTLQSQRDAFLEAGLRARYLLVRDRDAADEAHTGTDGEIDADGARAVAEFNAVIAYIDSAVEGGKKVQPTPSSLPWPVAPEGYACCNSWFASLPEGHQAVLRDDKWMLAHAAFDAGRAAAPQPPVGVTRSAVPWREAVLDLIDECPGLSMEQDHWLSRRVKELDFPSAPTPRLPTADHGILHLLRRLLSNQNTFTGPEFRAELTKIVGEAIAAAPQPPVEVTRPAVPEEFLESPDIPDEDSGLNTYYSRELVLECIVAALAAAPKPEAQPTEAAQPTDWRAAFDVWWSENRVKTHNLRSAEGFSRKAFHAGVLAAQKGGV